MPPTFPDTAIVDDAYADGGWRFEFTCHEAAEAYEVVSFEVHEALNAPYRIELWVTSVDHDTDPEALLGKSITLSALRPEHPARRFHGIVTRLQLTRTRLHTNLMMLEVRPALLWLQREITTRIFQDLDARQILEAVITPGLARYDRTLDASALDGTRFEVRSYCVQYRETSLDFVHRIMEEEGIGYYFDHWGPERLCLFHENRHLPRAGDEPIQFDPLVDRWSPENRIVSFEPHLQTGAGSVVVRAYDWARPNVRLEERSSAEAHSLRDAEVFIHDEGDSTTISEQSETITMLTAAAELALRPRGLPVGSGAVRQHLPGIPIGLFTSDNVSAQSRLHGALLERDRKTAKASGHVPDLFAGSTFVLLGCPTLGADGEYYIRSIRHRGGERGEAGVQDAPASAAPRPYTNDFECLPFERAWRPARCTPKPRVHGLQTARVVGPLGTDVHTDAFGRVRVKFLWDRRENDLRGEDSCWLRVSQLWAGNGAPGVVFIPRVGMEVVVSFIDGDPDRPIVLGCVYNGMNASPDLLPVRATKSIIRTRSVPHGEGYNELSFEDMAGLERIFIKAERDFDTVVGQDSRLLVRRDESRSVGGDSHIDIRNNQKVLVGKNRESQVIGRDSLNTAEDLRIHVGRSKVVEVEHQYAISAEHGLFAHATEGPVFLSQGEENSLDMSSEGDGGIALRTGGALLRMTTDCIELKVGGSIVRITEDRIQINQKTFPSGSAGS